MYLHLEHVKHLSVSSPPQQEFPHLTLFLKSFEELSSSAPGSLPPSLSPLLVVDARVPELSTPLQFPQWEETPARPGPTRTADAWRARRRSSVMSSYWRVMRVNRWLHWALRGNKGEEGFPERQIHHSHFKTKLPAQPQHGSLIDGMVLDVSNWRHDWPGVCYQVDQLYPRGPVPSVQCMVEGGSLWFQSLHGHWLHYNTLNIHVVMGSELITWHVQPESRASSSELYQKSFSVKLKTRLLFFFKLSFSNYCDT